MQTGQPSRTAFAAAAHRAAHQLLEKGSLFPDPLAIRILGQSPEVIAQEAEATPSRARMRLFIAARTRFAEDALAAAVAEGVTQLVVLGAGLDTFAYRNPYPTLRVFEVDHPATQTWKRQRLAEAAIPIPAALTYAPVDFEAQTLAQGLETAGFDPTQPTFFTWLGVVPYLTPEAMDATLSFIASLPAPAHVVFDYSDPPETFTPELREFHNLRAARVAALGESWINFPSAEALHPRLRALGFTKIEDLGPPEISARYFPNRTSTPHAKGAHMLYASKNKSNNKV
ncbi:class I SAM-dependent methyltransferase [Granulicella tundricola]|uniref:S-adenosyl-L-methionine-dependent methyltransferase n=1 Tax=Granulicella tundricola (strain ATCC BAA-1859 / DSM 23138 / MP5ACTX9) TaxID=1198114 RepID=E8X4J1_GRATM|nr:SAM-dependent methyltransferase [Granulicella tundricola]ADW69401.1 methyltransferase [Granulicella tundricola MP5ACTX9]